MKSGVGTEAGAAPCLASAVTVHVHQVLATGQPRAVHLTPSDTSEYVSLHVMTEFLSRVSLEVYLHFNPIPCPEQRDSSRSSSSF